MCFINSAEWAYVEQRDRISTLINLSCRKYSFEKLTQFLHGNNVLDASASNTDFFFPERYICFFKLAGSAYLEQNEHLSTVKSLIGRKCSLQRELPQGNDMLDVPASNNGGFLWRDTCISSTQLNRPVWKKESPSPP
jgi:hypothetical protein